MRIVALALVFAVACKSGSGDKGKQTVEPPTPTGSGSAPAPTSNLVVDIAELDKSCTADTDCALVYITPCEKRCGCAQHTIAAKDVPKFDAKVAAISCPAPDPEELKISCGSCMSPVPRCDAGTCVTTPAP